MSQTATIEINFKEGKKTIEVTLKKKHQIEECEEGKVVILRMKNGDTFTGLFKGMDESTIMITGLFSSNVMGVNIRSVDDYLEAN